MRFLVVGLSTLVVLSGECIQMPNQYGTVRINGFDSTGAALGPVEAELVGLYSGKLLQKTRKGTFDHVAFGPYLMRAQVNGFWGEGRVIHVQQQAVRERVQFAIGAECHYDDSSLSGMFSPSSPGHEVWIKAVPLRGIGGSESRVDSSGRFSLVGLTDGTYVIMALDGSSVLKTQVVQVSEATVVDFRLSAK